MRMNGTYTFILELTLTLQVLNRLTEGEREREKKIALKKRNLLKTNFLLMRKKSKGPVIGKE